MTVINCVYNVQKYSNTFGETKKEFIIVGIYAYKKNTYSQSDSSKNKPKQIVGLIVNKKAIKIN